MRAVGAVCPAVAPTVQLLMVLEAVRDENAATPQACPETVDLQIQHTEISAVCQTLSFSLSFSRHLGLLYPGF